MPCFGNILFKLARLPRLDTEPSSDTCIVKHCSWCYEDRVMNKLSILSLIFLSFQLSAVDLTELSPEELVEINERLEAFYAEESSPELLSQTTPKYSIRSQRFVRPNAFLRLKNTDKVPALPLHESAQVKATDAFQKYNKQVFLKRHFPELMDRASIQIRDRVEDLTDSWLEHATYDLDQIPVKGETASVPWSDDYWRTRWGLSSFRYSAYDPNSEFKTYKEAISAYAQPVEWLSVVKLPITELPARIVKWSPSEKYDLTVGDEAFTLTNEQKSEGASNIGSDGNVEEWMGLCHGWAPAALVVKRPLRQTTVVGAKGVQVEWYPADIKAMFTLAWANGDYENNFIGGRCDEKKPKLYPNGRLAQSQCFDNNPATFHLALGNMIGIAKVGFVYDKTFDYEVWNQPITAYEVEYFNPLDPSERSKDWKKVAVDYNHTFKQRDRFQNPLTRGFFTAGKYNDSRVKKIVGVINTVVYLSEVSPPTHSPEADPDEILRETYTYDLEFEERDGKFIPSGGEWHANAHPDFLWMPRKGSLASMSFDSTQLNYTGNAIPAETITSIARKSSKEAYPLCQVMKEILKRSTGEDSYLCK